MKPAIVVDPTVEPSKPGEWWERWFGEAHRQLVARCLEDYLERCRLRHCMMWRCIHCNSPVAQPGDKCQCRRDRAR